MIASSRPGDIHCWNAVTVYLDPDDARELSGGTRCFRHRIEGYRAPADGSPVTDAATLGYDPSVETRIEAYDYRPNRSWGALARVVVERKSGPRGPYELLRIERPRGDRPEGSLIAVPYQCNWGASGGILDNRSRWSFHLQHRTATGTVAGGVLIAVVADDAPIVMHQDHLAIEYGTAREEPSAELSSLPDGRPGVVALFSRPDRELAEHAKELGLPAVVTRDRTVVGLLQADAFRPLDDAPAIESARWIWPSELPEPERITLEASEGGGSFGHLGRACVITDLYGRRLPPFARPRLPQACGNSARFSHTEGLAVVTASWGSTPDMRGTLTAFSLEAQHKNRDGAIVIQRERIIDGPLDAATAEIPDFVAPFQAAARKARCATCTCVHYG